MGRERAKITTEHNNNNNNNNNVRTYSVSKESMFGITAEATAKQ